MTKLHLGCGEKHRIKGFINIDAQAYKNVDKACGIDKLPYKDDTITEIYASHCLEHFKHTETDRVLKEWFRVLKKGGVLWIAVPDFNAAISYYLNTGMLNNFLVNLIHGDQEKDYQFHYASFNYKTLLYALSIAGFKNVEHIKDMPYGLDDCSTLRVLDSDFKLSLNVRAVK